MILRRKRSKAAITVLVLTALFGAACGGDDDDSAAPDETEESANGAEEGENEPTSDIDGADTAAADLRAGLTSLLQEHVYLAALAIGSALRGDDAGFTAWATALNGPTDSNTADLVAAIGSAYGSEVGTAFDGLWRSDKHIPQFVAYTQATAKGDKAGQDAAVAQLTAYATEFGTTINSVNENLPADVVTDAITMHATELISVINAQKAGDQPAVYTALRQAFGHMADTAKALAAGTVAKVPDKFEGKADSAAADLRAAFTSLLAEHVWLAGSAAGAGLGGRTEQFNAVAAALNGETASNTADIVAAMGSLYGAEVGTAFEGLWRSEKHIPQFIAYVQATAKKDEAAKAAAVEQLTAYATEFGTTINSVNENLPAEVVTGAITMHATTLLAAIDAFGANDGTGPAKLRAAAHHMGDTAKALAVGTCAKVPDKC
jgi:hypothetical protein